MTHLLSRVPADALDVLGVVLENSGTLEILTVRQNCIHVQVGHAVNVRCVYCSSEMLKRSLFWKRNSFLSDLYLK